MSITPEQLQELISEVEREDPIDFADIPFAEHDLRELVANHLCEMATAMEEFSEQDRHMCLLAVAAKLVLENLVLHVRLLHDHPDAAGNTATMLLERLRQKK